MDVLLPPIDKDQINGKKKRKRRLIFEEINHAYYDSSFVSPREKMNGARDI